MSAYATAARANPDRPTILLVDDDSSIRAVFSTTLEYHGYSVLKARHADEALEISRHYRGTVDLLLADLMLPPKIRLADATRKLPVIHGLDLMKRVTAMRPGIRVLLFSGQPDQVLKGLGTIPPDITFLRKPFSLDTLVRSVRQTLDSPTGP